MVARRKTLGGGGVGPPAARAFPSISEAYRARPNLSELGHFMHSSSSRVNVPIEPIIVCIETLTMYS